LFVVARESKGALETKISFPSRIDTFHNVNEALEMILDRLTKQGIDVEKYPIRDQLLSDQDGMTRLINSWTSL
jgi:hypothetical protein